MARKPKLALPPPSSSSSSSSSGSDEKKKRGPGNPPFEIDMEVIDAILEMYAHTPTPIKTIINGIRERPELADRSCPSVSKFFDILNTHPEIRDRYMRAKVPRADALLDGAIEVASDRSQDIEIDPKTGAVRANFDIVQRARLKADTMVKVAEKLNPAYSSRPQGKSGDGSADGQDLATLSDDDLSSALESAAADLGVVLVQAEPAAQLEDLRRLAGALGFDLVARKV